MTEFFIINVLMMLAVRSIEQVAQVFNSSSIQSRPQTMRAHQQAVVQSQHDVVTCQGSRCNSFTNYGGKSELYSGARQARRNGHSAG